jgi:hypothetical protein
MRKINNSVHSRQKTLLPLHYKGKSATVLFREMIVVYCENNTKYMYCVLTLYQVVYIVTTGL